MPTTENQAICIPEKVLHEPLYQAALQNCIQHALAEDMPNGDCTTDNLIDQQHQSHQSRGLIESQQPMVVSGLLAAMETFKTVDANLQLTPHVEDGDTLPANAPILSIEGSTASILKAERLALNFLQHLSGIATLTYQYAATISRTNAKITHTRKTHPTLRFLETQAVVDGGGVRHRQSLSEFVMIKDNHLKAFSSLKVAVSTVRENTPAGMKVEVECDTIEQVKEALTCPIGDIDVILLDNMSPEQLRQCVALRGSLPIVLEASGGVTLNTVKAIAETGVDLISTSQLTMSAPACDIHLELK